MNCPGSGSMYGRSSSGVSRTGFIAKLRRELNRGSANRARTSSYWVTTQPLPPSGNTSGLTGSETWRSR